MALLTRERDRRDRAQFQDWEKKEEEFLYYQHKIRSEIRLREGRPKPIDLLSQHIIDPLMVFNDLSVEEIEELHIDIKMSLDLDRAKPNPTERKYWEALLVVCEWKLSELMKSVVFEERGFHTSTRGDVMSFLQGKSHGELESFQSQIESKMQFGTEWFEYWEAVLKRLHVCKAKAFLNENYSKKPKISQYADENNNDNFDAVIVSNDEIYPQKPKYFNRIHVGYEWNKYNRTHYDHDSLPPKTVKGYKFDIFYPDLVDKSKAPTYTIEKDGDSAETCVIRFHGGPPYEDLAFRIVNKKWETSIKKGFKCNFENGVLRLYFNFVRYTYCR